MCDEEAKRFEGPWFLDVNSTDEISSISSMSHFQGVPTDYVWLNNQIFMSALLHP